MTSSEPRRSILLGALIAPVGAPLGFLFCSTIFQLLQYGRPGLNNFWLAGVLINFVFGLPIAYLAMLIFGLPYAFWLERSGRLSWFSICAAATAFGTIVFPFTLQLLANGSLQLASFVAGAFVGLVCGVLFCVVTGPNNSFKPNTLRGGNLSR